MHAIAFTTTVTDKDWDTDLSAWRCPALKIPGACVECFFVFGSRVDPSWYEVNCELDIVRWVHSSERPQQATLLIKLTEELSTKELTVKWKKLAIMLPLFTSVIVALIAGIFSYRSSIVTPSNPLSSCADQVTIDAPSDNATVPIPVTVKGTYKNLPSGQKIYVLVFPTDTGRFYPQRTSVKEEPDSTWSCDVLIGLERDAGRVFFLYAVLADKEAQNRLNMYISQDKEVGDSPGLKEVPKGAQICSFVRVFRK
jgi:hypothetical protein